MGGELRDPNNLVESKFKRGFICDRWAILCQQVAKLSTLEADALEVCLSASVVVGQTHWFLPSFGIFFFLSICQFFLIVIVNRNSDQRCHHSMTPAIAPLTLLYKIVITLHFL